ncbi:putative phage abortive infection protein [Microbulbifer sp. OS29]|uniref:Phage abortive infection protein n=1 Tax=Microbulbifer okhotskensis TaxID=2926617 RepID=A0A9X2J5E3_9GAMM|nr:putative phage abortive infection protein [Microbulbifer okhotskensis]MCO1335457.1 putative phage abortive infection protein [Microbulbifer okhotskensis]
MCIKYSSGVWGAFGDFMGGVLNPIFAFMGLIALLLTISMQSEELNNSTRELRNSAEALAEQSKSLEKQNFENTFFQLVRLHNDIVGEIEIPASTTGVFKSSRVSGRACFKNIYERYENKYRYHAETEGDSCIAAQKGYRSYFGDVNNGLGHYFKNFYVIIYFIEESKIDNKEVYIRILKAQLSICEVAMIFYDCIAGPESVRAKEIFEKYSFFSDFDKQELLDSVAHPKMYAPSAFGEPLAVHMTKDPIEKPAVECT